MEVFELDYKYIEDYEEKHETVRTIEERGVWHILLPRRLDNRGSEYQEVISITGKKWQFHSKLKGNSDYFTSVYLSEDGTIQYENDMTGGILTAEDKFDPLLANSDFPYNVAAEMYYLKEQLGKILEILARVKEARKQRLLVRLRKLGYNSLEEAFSPITDHCVYCDLNDIAEELETYEDFIEVEGFSEREDFLQQGRRKTDVVYRMPTEQGLANIRELLSRIASEIADEEAALEDRKDFMDRKRNFTEWKGLEKVKYCEFEMSFPSIMSMTERQWEQYTSYVTKECEDYWPQDVVDEDGNVIERIPDFERMPVANINFPETKPIRTVQLHNNVWNRYTKAIMQIARLYLSLNADLLPSQLAKQVEDCTGIYGKETEDFSEGEELRFFIGKFIDSQTFILACNIEDIAISAMNLDFVRAIDEQNVFDSLARELRDDSIAQLRERMRHVALFNNARIKLQQLSGVKRIENGPDFEEK